MSDSDPGNPNPVEFFGTSPRKAWAPPRVILSELKRDTGTSKSDQFDPLDQAHAPSTVSGSAPS